MKSTLEERVARLEDVVFRQSPAGAWLTSVGAVTNDETSQEITREVLRQREAERDESRRDNSDVADVDQ
ncbi:MAG: hypothetical protein KDA89_07485 [Planctomycetaceae bacterium]|nr:hypothetical protein [Planctomycetaceae bacterium]